MYVNITQMDWLQFAEIGGVLMLSALLQSIAGFGFSLLLLPFLLSMDIMLPQAVAVGIICSCTQRLYSIKKLSSHVDWKTLRPMMFTGLLALPVGILIMNLLTSVKSEYIRQWIGIFILLTLGLQFVHLKPREHVPAIWGHVAAIFSGILNGIGNIGGPPIILWILSHQWTAEKMRITTMAYTLVFVPAQLVLLICVFRLNVLQACAVAVAYSPAILLATWLGLHAGRKLNQKHIRIMMQILLLIIAVVSIIRPFLGR